MSKQYPGGIISKTAPTPSGSFENSTAPGVWTLEQQAYWQKLGQWPTAGNTQNFIEDVFSTYLYTGTHPPTATQTVVNGIDLAGKGGLVWTKARNAAEAHILSNTATGVNNFLQSASDSENSVGTNWVTAFNSDGFTVGNNINYNIWNLASWTWRKQAKFFDIVTWTGSGANRTISHSLGSVPGCIMVKRLNAAANWAVYHRSLANTQYLVLNTTAAAATGATRWNSTTPTSSVFSLGTDATVNASGGTYVAYLFAHDAGGFGLTGTDNVISCGSYTGNGVVAGPSVALGYEPQWVLVKSSTAVGSDWYLMDIMRGMAQTQCNELYPNLSVAEVAQSKTIIPTATGFSVATTDAYINNNGSTYIYIAIRRGPMKVPTSGTSVFEPVLSSATASVLTSNFPVDMAIAGARGASQERGISDRLRGFATTSGGTTPWLVTQTTQAENVYSTYYNGTNTSIQTGAYFGSISLANYLFRRAPSFFDEVCYTGTGSATTQTHNLAAVPELMIVKIRNQAGAAWAVYNAASGNTKVIRLNTTAAETTSSAYWNNTTPTASVFTVGNDGDVNNSADTYVAYLFATCAGVSKVGSYTGTGAAQTINCGFTAGSRFVLIKRTDSTGDWYVWDSARGIIAGNDPYLLLNDTAAEVTGTDYIDTDNSGFEISSTAPAAINASAGTFIFLAIA